MNSFRRKLPILLQTEVAECGLACVAMISAYHGNRSEMRELRLRFSLSSKGASLQSVVEICTAMKMGSRALRLEIEDISELRLPCILHWDMNHFVVLRTVKRDRVSIHDPVTGLRTYTLREFGKHFTGVALEVWPAGDFSLREGKPPSRLALVAKYLADAKPELAKILLSAFILETLAVVLPFHLQWAVDRGLRYADGEMLVTLAFGFGILVAVQAVISAVRNWLVASVSMHLNFRWWSNVFSHLLRLPLNYFDRRHLGRIQSYFGSLQQIQLTLSTHFTQTIVDGVLVFGTLAMMLYYSVAASALSLGAAALYCALRWFGFHTLRDVKAEELMFAGKQYNHFLETLRGIQTVRLYGHTQQRRMHWLNILSDQFNAHLQAERILAIQRAANVLVFGLERVLVIWVITSAVLHNRFTLGMLFAFMAYREQFSARVSGLIDNIVELRMLGLHVERVADITEHQEEDVGSTLEQGVCADLDHLPASIELCNVSFRYASSEPFVLDNVSLRVEAGESLAITGPSGGGKTTLAKIMLGLLQPTSGEVKFGGRPLLQLGLDNYRRIVGTVMQDDTLFSGTLADNISFFGVDHDIGRIEACARLVNLHAEILGMPMEYDSLVGGIGTSLSGGQKQRLLLARALYKRPRILVLDEATSHLDMPNEKAVNLAIKNMQLTRIIIAHRPETVASAQRVIRLDSGRVVDNFCNPGNCDNLQSAGLIPRTEIATGGECSSIWESS